MVDHQGQDFSNAQAGRSIVAGDLTEIHQYAGPTALSGSIKDLVLKLQKEIEDDEKASGWIEDLLFFEENAPDDDIEGLEAKLSAAGMSQKSGMALKQKEMFAKFLEKRALYGAAQRLLALCLHRIFADFEAYVHPHCGKLPADELHLKIHDKIVCPIVQEFCHDAFSINHSLVLGMTYWLADRCYVRWHEAA